MFDAFRKIYAAEGIPGIYKGFWVSSFQIVSRLIYFSTYEQTRHLLYAYDIKENHVRALVAGTAASVVGQVRKIKFTKSFLYSVSFELHPGIHCSIRCSQSTSYGTWAEEGWSSECEW